MAAQGSGQSAMAHQAVLDFWFGAPGSTDYGRPRQCWFEKNPAFDADIRSRFLAVVEDAAAGRLASWAARADSLLALIVVLDQFPRNLFRNDPRAFAGDAAALAHAGEMLERGFDAQLLPVQRVFAYLPFEHSENMAMQDRSVALFSALARDNAGFDSFLDYAERHREVIRRFGRFPHRNALFGRVSTREEIEYLGQPGSGF